MKGRDLPVLSLYFLILLLLFSCDLDRSGEDDLRSRIGEMKILQSFTIPGAVNGLSRDSIGIFSGENIYIGLPHGATLPSTVYVDFSFLGVRVSPASNPLLTLVPGASQLTIAPMPTSIGIDVWSRDGTFRRYYLHTAIKPQSDISFNILPGDRTGPVNDPATRTNGPVSIDVEFTPPGSVIPAPSILDSSITAGDFAVYNCSVSNKSVNTANTSYSFDVNSGVSGPFSLYLSDSSVSDLNLGVGAEASNILSLIWDLDPPHTADGDYGIRASVISQDTITLSWSPAFDQYADVNDLEYKILRCPQGSESLITGNTGYNQTNTTYIVKDWSTPLVNNNLNPLEFTDSGLSHHTEYSYNIYVRDDLQNWQEYDCNTFTTQLEGIFAVDLVLRNNETVLIVAFNHNIYLDSNLSITLDSNNNQPFSSVVWYLDGYNTGAVGPQFQWLCSFSHFNQIYSSNPSLPPLSVIGPHTITCFAIDNGGAEHYAEITFQVGYP